MKRGSIHAQRLACRIQSGDVRGICRKSNGHADSSDPKRREHYDPDEDVRWADEEVR